MITGEGARVGGRFTYSGTHFNGFRATRQPSPCTGDYGHCVLMPETGELVFDEQTRESAYDVNRDTFRPEYLGVRLDRYAIQMELTAGERSAVCRFTFESANSGRLLMSPAKGSHLEIAGRTIRGCGTACEATPPTNFYAYFVIELDREVFESANSGRLLMSPAKESHLEIACRTIRGCGAACEATPPPNFYAYFVIKLDREVFESANSGLLLISPAKGSHLEIAGRTIRGCGTACEATPPPNLYAYFVIELDREVTAFGTRAGHKPSAGQAAVDGKNAQASVEFFTGDRRPVEVKVGTSYISYEQAERNLKRQIDGGFAAVHAKAADRWEKIDQASNPKAARTSNANVLFLTVSSTDVFVSLLRVGCGSEADPLQLLRRQGASRCGVHGQRILGCVAHELPVLVDRVSRAARRNSAGIPRFVSGRRTISAVATPSGSAVG